MDLVNILDDLKDIIQFQHFRFEPENAYPYGNNQIKHWINANLAFYLSPNLGGRCFLAYLIRSYQVGLERIPL